MDFDLNKVLSDVKASMGKNKKKASRVNLGTDLGTISTDPQDYVVMPSWFKENYGVLGFQFGKVYQWAGDSDSAKTSLAITAIKQAQEQGYAVLYVETELKTNVDDLLAWGVDPSKVMLVQSSVSEECFELTVKTLTAFFTAYPEAKLLLVFDSYGNTISQNDVHTDLTELKHRPGGAAKTNRAGLSQIIAFKNDYNVASLIINYNYDNMAAPGKTEAGGKALFFYCSLIVQTSRKAWITKTVKGQTVRRGAQVKWKVKKNHFTKNLKDENGNPILLPMEAIFNVTAEGITPAKEKPVEE